MDGSARELTAGEEDRGKRLDVYLHERQSFPSRAQAQRAIAGGEVRVNGEKVKAGYRLRAGDRIEITWRPPSPPALAPEEMALDIVYEDEDLLVINKPQGLVVHPAPGHLRGTLVNALLHHCRDLSGIGGTLRPGIVHRLDKDTSGLILVAKHDHAHLCLAKQLKAHTVQRVYLALVHGHPPAAGTIDAPIGRHVRQRKKMSVRLSGGKKAVTHFRVLEYLAAYALVEAKLETGRTHQVRVHLASLGHPVVGDPLYGRRRPSLSVPGQLLHAYRLSFYHPRSGRLMEFTAPLPPVFAATLEALRQGRRKDR